MYGMNLNLMRTNYLPTIVHTFHKVMLKQTPRTYFCKPVLYDGEQYKMHDLTQLIRGNLM